MFRGSQKKEPPKNAPFDVDVERGTIKHKSDGQRLMAVGSVGWATIEKELTSTFVSGAAVILQRMGYSYGRYLGRLARTNQTTPENAFEALRAFSADLGWGEMRLSGGDLFGGQARIVLGNCFFCLHFREATEPACKMLVGLLSGVSDEIIGGTHRVVEEKCIAQGDDVCEMLIELVTS